VHFSEYFVLRDVLRGCIGQTTNYWYFLTDQSLFSQVVFLSGFQVLSMATHDYRLELSLPSKNLKRIWNRRGYGFPMIKLQGHPHQLDTHHSPAKNCRVPGFPKWWLWFPRLRKTIFLVKNQVTFRLESHENISPLSEMVVPICTIFLTMPQNAISMVKPLRNHGMRRSLMFKSKSILAKTNESFEGGSKKACSSNIQQYQHRFWLRWSKQNFP